MNQIRDRIKELRRVKASSLVDHEQNWRLHPESQKKALSGVLQDIGFADACLVRELGDGRYQILDGHCRKELSGDSEIPVLVLDVTEQEGKKLLATLDPLSGMAEMDSAALSTLLTEIETSNADVQQLLDNLNSEAIEASVMAKPESDQSGPADFTAGRNAVISYVLIFDNADQQTVWFKLLKYLKIKNPESPTIAQNLTDFIQENLES